MVQIKKIPVRYERIVTTEAGEQEVGIVNAGNSYSILFEEAELEQMKSPDVGVARRALFLVGMNIGAKYDEVKDRTALLTAISHACQMDNVDVHYMFAPGAIMRGVEFGQRLLKVADTTQDFSFDEWLAQQQSSSER